MKPVAAVAILALLAACSSTSTQVGAPRVVNVIPGATPAGAVLSGSMRNLVSRTSPSYVTLIVHKSQKRSKLSGDSLPDAVTSGSGFVIDNAGHVLTAGHVAVARGYTVDAKDVNGRLYQGRVVGVRKDNDMAIVKLKGFAGSPVIPADSPCMRRGEPLFSLGKPHARGDTARIGELEAMSFGRPVTYDGFGYPDAMVLRMATKKGESGGPVFNQSGKLTGMVVSTLSDGNGRPLNLAHAIPAPSLASFVCTTTSCSQSWKAMSNKSVATCKG